MNPFSRNDWKKSAYKGGPGRAICGAILLLAVIIFIVKSCLGIDL